MELSNHYSHECFFLNELCQHNLPSLQCSEADCFADFVLQKDIRLNHQGAYSLEFKKLMCHANSNGMYDMMGYLEENYKRKGDTWNSCSLLCSR
jgi:hypothetical protein